MKHNRNIIYLAGFLFSLPIALSSYINSSFLSTFVGENMVGVIYALGSFCSILALLLVPKIWEKLGGYKFLLAVTFLDALSFLALVFFKNSQAVIISFILGMSLNTLIVFSLDEILKIFSKESTTGKIRGAYLALSNLAWVLAQFGAGTVLGGFSFRMIYTISFVIMILFLFISYFSLSRIPDPTYDRSKAIKYIKEFFKKKNLLCIYSTSLLLQLFYSWMVIYTPIYLYSHLGFSWKEIGFIFAIMLLPFVIVPFPLGKYADKFGERKILMLGFAIASLSTLSLFFIHKHEIWVWALVLFITRIGAATIELMSDAYFFKHIEPENEEFVGVYRSASPVAYILGPLLALIALVVIPSFNYIYIVLGTIMLWGVYLSSTIRKSDV